MVAHEPAAFVAARSRLISRDAASASVRRIGWSGGETEVLELGSGPPLLLIHGGLSSSCEWVPILADLGEDHHVFAVDQPGHGGADPFNYDDVDLNRHALRFVGEVLDALDLERTAIMANSIGGFLAARFAQSEPERITHLVFAGFPAGLRRKAPLPFRMMSLPLVPRLAFGNPTPEGSRKFMGSGLGVAQPDLLSDELIDCDVENTKLHLESFLTLVNRIADMGGVRKRWLLEEGWKTMPKCTTILWGDNEPWATPQWGMTMLADLGAEIRVVPIPGAGHLPWWDQPELVVQEAKQVLNA